MREIKIFVYDSRKKYATVEYFKESSIKKSGMTKEEFFMYKYKSCLRNLRKVKAPAKKD